MLASADDVVRAAGANATPPALVRFGFDDAEPVTGPDTLAVFEHARGHVRLTRDIVYSGRRSIVLHDVAGDGDFPEMQGFFPLRRDGELLLSFAILVTDPRHELNVALAGPAGFRLGRDGIAFWLATRDGALVHVSDSIPKRLARLEPFVWYRIETVYRVADGRYDLRVFAEDRPEAVVALVDQPNAANAPGSGVSLFSLIGDNGDDLSDVTYFVDDIVVAAEPFPELPPLVAPGRRRLFVDRLEGYDEPAGVAAPSCPPALTPEDFGVRAGRGDAPAAVEKILVAAAGSAPSRAFHWLMLGRHTADARDFAARMAQRSAIDAVERARWIELGGDLQREPEVERRLRERMYGRLREDS